MRLADVVAAVPPAISSSRSDPRCRWCCRRATIFILVAAVDVGRRGQGRRPTVAAERQTGHAEGRRAAAPGSSGVTCRRQLRLRRASGVAAPAFVLAEATPRSSPGLFDTVPSWGSHRRTQPRPARSRSTIAPAFAVFAELLVNLAVGDVAEAVESSELTRSGPWRPLTSRQLEVSAARPCRSPSGRIRSARRTPASRNRPRESRCGARRLPGSASGTCRRSRPRGR